MWIGLEKQGINWKYWQKQVYLQNLDTDHVYKNSSQLHNAVSEIQNWNTTYEFAYLYLTAQISICPIRKVSANYYDIDCWHEKHNNQNKLAVIMISHIYKNAKYFLNNYIQLVTKYHYYKFCNQPHIFFR